MGVPYRYAPGFTFLFALSLFAQGPVSFRSEVNLVEVAAIVRSTDGHLIRDLSREDFEVLEDGVPQKVQVFARESELPLSLGLIVDVSGSQDKFLKQHNRDIETFLNTVLRPSDRVFAVCFGNHLRLVTNTTSSALQVRQGLERFDKGERRFPELGPPEERDLGTALYDAVYYGITEKLETAGERRRALIVFSDGEENSSSHDLLDAIETAQDKDTLVYCIRYTQRQHGKLTARSKYGIQVMHHLANLSGAADFDALSARLEDVFAQIGDELRSMYSMGYVSSNGQLHDGSFRKLTVRCLQPGTRVRAKTGYYAQ